MITKDWRTSERKYEVQVERNVRIPVRDGTVLVGDVFRPRGDGRFPVILGCHPYNTELQTAPLIPIGYGPTRGFIEAGDPEFYVRRGYVQAVVNVRGTGRSQGTYQLMGPQEVQDVIDVIEWLAHQPWSTGNVGMFGVSYFAWIQAQVAALNPKHLKAIFAPFGATDFYRDVFYRGGILNHKFLAHWSHHWDNPRTKSWTRQHLGEDGYRQAIERAMQDEEIMAVPELRAALEHPDEERNPAVVDVILQNLDGPFYQERNVDYSDARTPALFGGCWGMYGLHLPGAFRSWENWKGPKKMIVGPPIYLDRPVYQYQYESLRWFDHWLKGVENGVMDEPPVRLFLPPTGEWVAEEDWPLARTRWTEFYLHEGGLLSEHEFWPNESCTNFVDSTLAHGEVTFSTPAMVETTEIVGPVSLTLYASSTDEEVLLFITLLAVDAKGEERELTRGWLRGSQRRWEEGSPPWAPRIAHTAREPLEPGQIYELRIPVVPTATVLTPGERLALRIKGSDPEPAKNRIHSISRGGLWHQTPVRVTIYHDADHPSTLLLPIARGNVIGTFLSGGVLPERDPGVEPFSKIDMPKE